MNSENSIEATKKTQIRNFVIVFAVIVSAFAFIFLVVLNNSKTKTEIQAKNTEFASPIKHIDAGSVLIERTGTRLANVEKATEGLQKTVDELNKEKQQKEAQAPHEQEKFIALNNRLTELEKKIEAAATNSAATGSVFPTVPGQPAGVPGQSQEVLMTQGIRDDAVTLDSREDVLSIPVKNPKDYVPSGTFVKAVALGGADASAAVNAQSNPQPMLFRVIEDGTMPNNKKSHLKGCLATAAVVGDISSERGLIRLETLSCVEPETNRIIDLNVEGTVFGSEGKSGIRGIPMWREGALLQRAFAAGALSGLASGLSQSFTKTSVSPLGSVQSINSNVKDILGQGVTGGLGNAMEKLADYNIRRAEQYHPVLQLSAGTIVDLVFLKGFYLDDAKQTGGTKNRIMNMANTVENKVGNLSNIPNLTITPEQAAKINARTAELN